MNKVLITGSSGFIGSHLLKMMPDAVPYDLKEGKNILNKVDLEKSMKGCDSVVHLAAHTHLMSSWEDPSKCYLTNVFGTSNVLETAVKLGIKRIIFASSSAIYASTENPYAASKAMGEGLLKVREDEIRSIIFRFFNVYGIGQNPDYGTAIPAFISGIKKGEITIYGDGKQTRDFIHVDDICQMLKFAATTELPENFPKVFQTDLGTGKSYAIKELAYIIMGLMNKQAKIKYQPARKEVLHSQADISLVKKVFNFEPKITLLEGLERIIKDGI